MHRSVQNVKNYDELVSFRNYNHFLTVKDSNYAVISWIFATVIATVHLTLKVFNFELAVPGHRNIGVKKMNLRHQLDNYDLIII